MLHQSSTCIEEGTPSLRLHEKTLFLTTTPCHKFLNDTFHSPPFKPTIGAPLLFLQRPINSQKRLEETAAQTHTIKKRGKKHAELTYGEEST
jgi:hypothetical protein